MTVGRHIAIGFPVPSPKGKPAGEAEAAVRDAGHIAWVLGSLGQVWKQEPDLRFGQVVASVIRFKLPMKTLQFIENEDFRRVKGGGGSRSSTRGPR